MDIKNEFENENWKPIKGYPGYEVSDLGNVRSLNYRRKKEIKNLKQSTNNAGYMYISLPGVDGTYKKIMVHRLVAETFLDNPENRPHVDHINTEKQDNRKINLKYVYPSENARNPITYARMKAASLKRADELAQTVYVYTNDLDLLTAYTSTSVAAQRTGLSQGNIARCCQGELKRYKGLIYSYIPIKDIKDREEIENNQNEKRIHILRINERNMKKWMEKPENRDKQRRRSKEYYHKKKGRTE